MKEATKKGSQTPLFPRSLVLGSIEHDTTSQIENETLCAFYREYALMSVGLLKVAVMVTT